MAITATGPIGNSPATADGVCAQDDRLRNVNRRLKAARKTTGGNPNGNEKMRPQSVYVPSEFRPEVLQPALRGGKGQGRSELSMRASRVRGEGGVRF